MSNGFNLLYTPLNLVIEIKKAQLITKI